MKTIFMCIIATVATGITYSQNVGIGTTSPNSSAKLEIHSTNAGLLPPRMTYTQRNAIANPAQGLIVYCTDCGPNGQLQNFDGVNWLSMVAGIGATGPVIPTVTTAAATSITATTANSGGNVTADGGGVVTRRGLIYSTGTITDTNSTSGGGKIIAGTGGTGVYTISLTGLSAAFTYHIRAFAVNTAGVAYGSDLTFTTLPLLPTVLTTAATGITASSANSGGNVTNDGGATVTRRGLIYSTSVITDTNSISGGGKIIDGSTGTGVFVSSVTGLLPATLYHIRAFAVNSQGASYGSDLSFTTSAALATITTSAATSVNIATATSGGNITADGGATVTRRGLIYSTAVIIDTNSTTGGGKIINGSGGTGAYSSSLTGLSSGTPYHIRAFAVNAAGVSYGSDLTFTTYPTLALGQTWGGGIVAYIAPPSDPNLYVPGEVHGFIIASSDQSGGIQWYNGSYLATNALAANAGTGLANTNTIVSLQGAGSYAAKLCADLVLNGYDDWHLPSTGELSIIANNNGYIGISPAAIYWSSTEYPDIVGGSPTIAFYVALPSGAGGPFDKSTLCHVRAIRYF